MTRRILILVLTLLAAGTDDARADEPSFDALKDALTHEWLTVGMLFQTVADFQPERDLPGENGFSIANFRLLARGRLDEGFSYFLQTNFAGSPAILDARMSFHAGEFVTLDMGAMKSPFSAEFLIPASGIDFVNRSGVVQLLAPGRQIGFQLRSRHEHVVHWGAGVFNGNGVKANGNDGSGVLGVARVALEDVVDGRRWQLGVSAATGKDDGSPVAAFDSFTGRRELVGADGRLESGRLFASGELIKGWLNPDGDSRVEAWGYQLTGGVMVSEKAQFLVRFDSVDLGSGEDIRTILFGANVWPSSATELQLNLLLPTAESSSRDPQILLNAQLGF